MLAELPSDGDSRPGVLQSLRLQERSSAEESASVELPEWSFDQAVLVGAGSVDAAAAAAAAAAVVSEDGPLRQVSDGATPPPASTVDLMDLHNASRGLGRPCKQKKAGRKDSRAQSVGCGRERPEARPEARSGEVCVTEISWGGPEPCKEPCKNFAVGCCLLGESCPFGHDAQPQDEKGRMVLSLFCLFVNSCRALSQIWVAVIVQRFVIQPLVDRGAKTESGTPCTS